MNLQQNKWTVIATAHTDINSRRRWTFQSGFDERDVQAAVKREAIIVMHRRAGLELQLVAMLPPPAWKRVIHWRLRNPLILPHMKVKAA